MGELSCPFCDSEDIRTSATRTLFQCRACREWFEEEDLTDRPVRRTKDDHEPSRWE